MTLRPHHFAWINDTIVIPGTLLALLAVIGLGSTWLVMSASGSASVAQVGVYFRIAAKALAFFVVAFLVVGIFSVRGV